jgi:acetyl esterase/lipase
MTKDTVDYTRAIRSTPDPKAKSSPRPLISYLTDILSKLLTVPILVAELPYLFYTRLFKRQSSPEWSFTRLLGVNVMRIGALVSSPWLPQPRSEEEQWGIPADGQPYRDAISRGDLDFEVVKLEPVGDYMRKGIANVPQVLAQPTPGFWFKSKGGRTDKVIFHIHGGYVYFCLGSFNVQELKIRAYIRGHPMWTPLALGLAQETGIAVFCMFHIRLAPLSAADLAAVNYRKCLSDATAFPAPLLDCLSAYLYLLKTYDSSAITFAGDSAGAHMCLFLSRYLTVVDLPLPSALGLISPWSDFAPSYPSYTRHAWFDFLQPRRLHRAIESATRWYATYTKSSVWFSPAKAAKGDWEYLAKAGIEVHLALGTRELFEDEIRLLKAVMDRDGVSTHLYEVSPLIPFISYQLTCSI